MNYLQYLDDGGLTKRTMKRYVSEDWPRGNAGHMLIEGLGDFLENAKIAYNKFKENRDIPVKSGYGYITRREGVPVIVHADGTYEPYNESDYTVVLSSDHGTVRVPKRGS